MWTVVVAAALEELGVPGQAWPVIGGARGGARRRGDRRRARGRPMTAWLDGAAELARRARVARPGAWTERAAVDCEIVAARCAVAAAAVERLAAGDVVTVERARGGLELVVGDGTVALAAVAGAVVATVASEYVPRDMALPDDAHVELTVAVGTARLSVRQLGELAVGVTVPLGRSAGGPFELRAGGRVIGRGELVDIDGELGVRVVSLGDST